MSRGASGRDHGVLVVDKPVGPTSHDAVARARRALGTKRVGHAGTLDPMASGVLVVLVGEGTKLAPFLTAHDKSYLATVAFGASTTTLDAEGEVTRHEDPPAWLRDELLAAEELRARRAGERSTGPSADEDLARAAPRLHAALEAELARTEQAPPAFSAIKIGGRRSYDIARAGDDPELALRSVSARSIELAEGTDATGSSPRLALSLRVSKGYYVRSLARDIGERLGVPSHLAALRRTRSGPFSIATATRLDVSVDQVRAALIPLAEAAQRSLPAARLTASGEERARHGKPLDASHFEAEPPTGDDLCAWLDATGRLVAVGRREGGSLVIQRGFAKEEDRAKPDGEPS